MSAPSRIVPPEKQNRNRGLEEPIPEPKEFLPPQHQDRQPGLQAPMRPQPESIRDSYKGSGKLRDKVALITGGDSGIGRAIALHYAREGADVAIAYLDEHEDAEATKRLVEHGEGRRCVTMAGDLRKESFCRETIARVVEAFGKLDVLVNHVGEIHHRDHDRALEDVDMAQMRSMFETNIFSFFYLTQAALPHLKEGASVINTTSVDAFMGTAHLIDYDATQGAVVAFTRSLSRALVKRGIRVNGVAPGPVWTPFIPSAFPADEVAKFGGTFPMGRPGQPSEIAPCYVFLASEDASYMTGQVMHPNGGVII